MDYENTIIFPPKVLNAQICMECLNYLSVKPVMMTKDGKTICGRCVRQHKNPDELKMSLYNTVAKVCMFSCINHYDGCNDIFLFSTILGHEFACTGKVYSCLHCSFKGNSCQFIQHYKQRHTGKILKDGIFKIDPRIDLDDSEDDLIYVDVHCIAVIKRVIKQEILNVSLRILNILSRNSKLSKYHLRFFKPNLKFFKPSFKLEYVTDPIEFQSTDCFQIDILELLQMFSFSPIFCDVILNQEETADLLDAKDYDMRLTYLSLEHYTWLEEELYRREVLKIRLEKQSLSNPLNVIKKIIKLFQRSEFNCINCNTMITEKFYIFVCQQSHICCVNCLSDYCTLCKANCDWTNYKDLFQDLELACDWNNCDVNLKIHEYLLHKQVCELRQYKCPLESCDFNGKKAEFISHWHSQNKPLKIGKTVDFILESCDIYWLIDYRYELLHVKCTWNLSERILRLTICEDNVMIPNNYGIQLRYFSTDSKGYELLSELTQEGDTKSLVYNNCGRYGDVKYYKFRLIVHTK